MSIFVYNIIHMKDIQHYKTQILQLYVEEKMSIKKIASIVHKSKINISKLLKQEKVLKSISQWRTKYTLNDNYFENIDTEGKAYFLGLMFSDGNITNIGNSCKVILTSKDKSILLLFLKELNSTGIIYREFHKKYKKECFKICITSKKMYNDLNILGCIPRKSLILKFPNSLSKDFIPHFIRGYFDGDGSVSIVNIKNTTWKRLISSFAGTKKLITILQKQLPIPIKKLSKTKNLYILNFSVQDSVTLYKYMYNNATIYLTRKYDIFNNFIKQRGSTTTIDNPHKWRVKV